MKFPRRRIRADPQPARRRSAGYLTLPRRTVLGATISNSLAVLPVFLLGGTAVLVRRDLGFSESQLGAAVSLFFLVSAAGSVPGGRIGERIGAYRAMAISAAGSGAALLGIAAAAASYLQLLAWLCLAAAANALAQPATNLALARGVSPSRQGLAFGIKQSAIPLATLVSGLAVPIIGLTVGWRWAFAGGALGAVLFAVAAPKPERVRGARRRARPALETGMRSLLVLAAAAGLGAAAANSMGAFYVESAVAHGISPGAAGLWFAAGSIAGVTGRVLTGWFADRRAGGHFAVVALLLMAGAGGFALLASPGRPAVLAIATVLAFAAGWGWTGLFNFAVVRWNRAAPASATGITQAGIFIGGVIGPLAFGALAEHVSYAVAWWSGAVWLLAAAGLVRLGRLLLVADLRAKGLVP